MLYCAVAHYFLELCIIFCLNLMHKNSEHMFVCKELHSNYPQRGLMSALLVNWHFPGHPKCKYNIAVPFFNQLFSCHRQIFYARNSVTLHFYFWVVFCNCFHCKATHVSPCEHCICNADFHGKSPTSFTLLPSLRLNFFLMFTWAITSTMFFGRFVLSGNTSAPFSSLFMRIFAATNPPNVLP